ncbi:RING-H2 finger protein ATL66 [Cucurbita maxima]|uniref:RING-type E3 ubiquitin transferase n=1 Tax=Cucurbita maxima TaxID=3661 RepID=A0A6J1K4V5_CUCMA|nr:RING-H2 finger protein ATL66 [Cucurbita maxima]
MSDTVPKAQEPFPFFLYPFPPPLRFSGHRIRRRGDSSVCFDELEVVMATLQAPPSVHWHFTELDDRIFQIRGRTIFFIAVLFAVILLVTFIFLYARWVCRYHSLMTFSTAVPGVRSSRSPPQQGLDQAAINCQPITLYKEAAAVEEAAATPAATAAECCICLGVFEDGEKVKILALCHHCFHSECVDQWLRLQSSCPLCRISLRAADNSNNLQMV